MDSESIFNGLIESFRAYYDIKTEDVEAPFMAEAEFHSDDTMYFLIKAAKMSQSDSHEFVYFATEDVLDERRLKELDDIAWERGIARANPGPGHHYSDVTLIIVADAFEGNIEGSVKKLTHRKSYNHMLWGFSNYRLVAIESKSGNFAVNRQGKTLRKLVCKAIGK